MLGIISFAITEVYCISLPLRVQDRWQHGGRAFDEAAETEAAFVSGHFGAWVPDYCDQVLSCADTAFFKLIAVMAKSLVE